MWFILLIVKQANENQDTENACYANFCERSEEIYDFVWLCFLGNRNINKISYLE